jgi:lysophospholipase L1-like esterase
MNGSPANADRVRRKPSLAIRLLLLLCGGLAGLLLAELLLRIAGVSYPLPYEPDPFCGSRLQPGFTAWFTKEGRALVHINSAGFRDVEHAVPKPPHTVRIAVLGDSFAEAMQVPLDRTFWSVLERELSLKKTFGTDRVEVLNFGVSGYGTAQELQALRNHVWPYSPDIVLLAFLAGNDVRNNSRELEPDKVRPFFTLRDGQLVLDDTFLEDPDYRKARGMWTRTKVAAINASRVLQLANEWKNRAGARLADSSSSMAHTSAGEPDAFQEHPTGEWIAAWQATEQLVSQMHKECDEHGARFCVAIVTEDFQVHPDPAERRRIMAERNIKDPHAADKRIEAIGTREGFVVIRLSDTIGQYAEAHNAFVHGFSNTRWGTGHWNELGHRLAGERIATGIDQVVRGGNNQ